MIRLSTYMKVYKVGDIVDVAVNGAVQKGMPHKYYHGKTGIVYNVTKSSVGVIFYKVVGNRYLEKRVSVRVEHVKHSKCRDDFLRRVKENARKQKEAKAKGETVQLKRLPEAPREARVIKTESNAVETLHAAAYGKAIALGCLHELTLCRNHYLNVIALFWFGCVSSLFHIPSSTIDSFLQPESTLQNFDLIASSLDVLLTWVARA